MPLVYTECMNNTYTLRFITWDIFQQTNYCTSRNKIIYDYSCKQNVYFSLLVCWLNYLKDSIDIEIIFHLDL